MNRNAGRGRIINRYCHGSVSNKSLIDEVTVDANPPLRRKYPLVITLGMDLRRYRPISISNDSFYR